MTFDLETYSLIALVAIFILLVIWVIHLEFLIKRLMAGKDGKRIDEILQAIQKDISQLKKYKEVSENYIEQMDGRLRKSITGVETIRFNPFKGVGAGSNQSFASSFVNEDGNGVIISSLYARDHVSVFAKPVKNFNPQYEVSSEEKESLEKAKAQIKK